MKNFAILLSAIIAVAACLGSAPASEWKTVLDRDVRAAKLMVEGAVET